VSGRGPAAARGATLLTALAPHPGLAAVHVSSVVLGVGVGVVAYGLSASLLAALLTGTAAGTVLMFATARYQWGRWCRASSAPARTSTLPDSLRTR
jgi:hypothetical protein